MRWLYCIVWFCSLTFTTPNELEVQEDQTSIVSLQAARNAYAVKWSNLIVSNDRKKLLDFAPGYVSSGRMLGIIGPSGSGKSTFLKTLSNRLPSKLKIEGNVRIVDIKDNCLLEDSGGRRLADEEVAYVYQDDNFFGMLTVYETLKLAIDLQRNSNVYRRSAQKISEENVHQTISEVLRVMGLSKVAHMRVGGASIGGDQSHGISGGERKRLAVACELLSNPLVLIADEPTSGLDSFQALQVMQILQSLAQKRQMITICVVHQPRSTIWNLFDDVMILTPLGEIAYFGSRENVLPYFQSIGYQCPDNTNPAEFLIDLVSINSTSSQYSEASLQRANHLARCYQEYLQQKKKY